MLKDYPSLKNITSTGGEVLRAFLKGEPVYKRWFNGRKNRLELWKVELESLRKDEETGKISLRVRYPVVNGRARISHIDRTFVTGEAIESKAMWELLPDIYKADFTQNSTVANEVEVEQ